MRPRRPRTFALSKLLYSGTCQAQSAARAEQNSCFRQGRRVVTANVVQSVGSERESVYSPKCTIALETRLSSITGYRLVTDPRNRAVHAIAAKVFASQHGYIIRRSNFQRLAKHGGWVWLPRHTSLSSSGTWIA